MLVKNIRYGSFRVRKSFGSVLLIFSCSVECASLFDVSNVKAGFQAVFKRREHHLRTWGFNFKYLFYIKVRFKGFGVTRNLRKLISSVNFWDKTVWRLKREYLCMRFCSLFFGWYSKKLPFFWLSSCFYWSISS